MMDIVTTIETLIKAAQLAFKIIYALALTDWRYPPNCSLVNGTYFDFIIIGGGASGSILANRLTANSSYSSLVVESGGNPPIQADIASLFPLLTKTDFDHNCTSENDHKTAQNLRDGVVRLTAGNMLGGSSSLHHMLYTRPDPADLNDWANTLNDPAWNYTNTFKYMIRQENLIDPELCNSSYVGLHGTDGPIKIQRQLSSEIDGILEAAQELGHEYVEDSTSATSIKGIFQPLFGIDDQRRQSCANTYLSEAKSRANLCVARYTSAIKILFKGTTAIGVQVVDANGDVYVLYARKEVIVAAGTLNSPKILMLSGIGPADHLESLGIDVIADLPVGQNYQDQPSALLVYQMKANNATNPAINPFKFPAQTAILNGAINSLQPYPDYQAIILYSLHDSTVAAQLHTLTFSLKDSLCNKFYAASEGRDLATILVSLSKPKSRGKLLLRSANYTDKPIVYTGIYSDLEGADLALMTEALVAVNKLTTTTYFKSVNATLVPLDECSSYAGTEYMKCHALATSGIMWHYTGTCSMGLVLDTDLRVKGVEHLSVIDASSMPGTVSGNNNPAVNMVAERGASLILDRWNILT